MPVSHGLKRWNETWRLLGDMLIIDLDVAFDGIGQVLGGVEAGGGQNVGDAPVEAFDHAIGLGSSRFGEPVLDAVVGTDPIGHRSAGARRWHRSDQ